MYNREPQYDRVSFAQPRYKKKSSKLSDGDISRLRQIYQDKQFTKKQLMREFNISRSTLNFYLSSKEQQNKRRIQIQKSYYKYRDKNIKRNKEYWQKTKFKVLNHYSNYDIKCNCCGERHIEFLAIDHINNDGKEHRKKIGPNLYYWIINNNYPNDFQVLCTNCNVYKGLESNHICIHQKERLLQAMHLDFKPHPSMEIFNRLDKQIEKARVKKGDD